MIHILLHRRRKGRRARFLRLEIADNLFGEYSMLVERGAAGSGPGSARIAWFSNLREACGAAEAARSGALRRGYRLTRASPAPEAAPRA